MPNWSEFLMLVSRNWRSPKARTIPQPPIPGCEGLEDRMLLSAAAANHCPIASPVVATHIVTPPIIASNPVLGSSTGTGVTLQVQQGVKFTANLGNFITIAPGTNLHVSIRWGDGTASQGTLKPDGIVGLDQINFEVDGTHTYRHAGTFNIHVTVIRGGASTKSTPFMVANFTAQAIVSPKT
ncbi:MAG: hypothetical protein JWM11_2967 [Planctomycetaceae bacterium]|nr:hypothetical protein [Planctomycetaceae bacterium]